MEETDDFDGLDDEEVIPAGEVEEDAPVCANDYSPFTGLQGISNNLPARDMQLCPKLAQVIRLFRDSEVEIRDEICRNLERMKNGQERLTEDLMN